MTILICSGTLFSGWRKTLEILLPEDSINHPVNDEFTSLDLEICNQQFPQSREVERELFKPDRKFTNKACQLLSGIENDSVLAWCNNNSSLYLNFWKTTADNAKFVLLYSSPELELSNYISTHPFKTSRIEEIVNAWLIRTRAMLNFFMNNRDRCLLIGVQTVESGNGSFIQTLNEQFDLKLVAPKPSITASPNENSALIQYMSTTLLLKNHQVSELFDEVRSAATIIGDQDKSIPDINDRNRSLINAFLNEATACQQLRDTQSGLETELYLGQLQINQMQQELEFYFNESIEQEKVADIVAEYLSNDPLLKIVRHVRQLQ